jgi:hypothetical protein
VKDTTCTNHSVYRLHFKNKLGAFDSFSFIRASQINTNIERKKYERGKVQPQSASTSTYYIKNRFETDFYTQYEHTIKINSDWITETQSVWLEELLTSPEVYLDISTDVVAVNIVDTNYTQRQHKTDKIFNLELSIKYTFKETRQGA